MMHNISKFRPTKLIAFISIVFCGLSVVVQAAGAMKVQANRVAEVALISGKTYRNPFLEIELNAVITQPDTYKLRVPMFWAGGKRWCLRYASSVAGVHTFRTECSDKNNAKLHGVEGKIEVMTYTDENPLYRHGPIRVADDKRHFEHADGTPFLWLGDTWWKNLCKRMTWEGFQELTADRKAKGFNVVQIVCGPYPDENMMEARWENEGGKPYETKDFSRVNPTYFEYADRRIKHLVDAGIVPVIVGGWGRPQHGGKSTLVQVGLDGFKRHWRNLVARYGAYPTVWMVGGEAKDAYGPWSTLAEYLKDIDPYHPLLCYHAPGHPREMLRDNSMFDFDMVAFGHDGMKTVNRTAQLMQSCLEMFPKRPVLCGEACYEGHMQTNFQDHQRYMFWRFLLSGAAGHTYGAAGIWHGSVEGDPGINPVYDWTTWRQGMNYPGAIQLGLGKRLLETYHWWRFESHPEWAEKDCFAAGIPGEVRIIYQPKRDIYNWKGTIVKHLEPDVSYSVFYFDPVTGRRFEQGTVINKGPMTSSGEYKAPRLPSPQDWVLVLERVKKYDDVTLESPYKTDIPPSRIQAIVTIDTPAKRQSYSPMIFGGFLEHFGRQVYGGVFEPGSPLADEKGFRKDVIEALKELRISVVRWPGGCFASGYHWKDGVGSSRKPTPDPVWGVQESNKFGTSEFVEWCRLIGSEPYICTNAGNGTTEEMEEWVEYCNSDEGLYAEMRKGSGHDKPFDVRYWSIGNENWGAHEIGVKTPAQWGPLVHKCAELMLAADPELVLLAAATTDRSWTLPLLKAAGEHLDYVCIHQYWLGLWGKNEMPNYLSCIMLSDGPEQTIVSVIDILEEAGYRGKIKIAFDEWNLRGWHHPGFPRKTISAPSNPEVKKLIQARGKNAIAPQYTMADALFSASFLNACLRHADDIGMANIAPIVNTRGPLFVHPRGIVKRTHFHTMAMYANELEEYVSSVKVTSGKLTHGNNSVAVVDAIATVDKSGEKWAISLVNRHPSDSVACTIKIKDMLLNGEYDATVLTGESADSYNDIEHPNRVVPKKTKLTFKKGVINLSPHSLTIVEVSTK